MSVGPCENYPSQVVWVLRKHIHSSKKHKNWLSASIVRFFPPTEFPHSAAAVTRGFKTYMSVISTHTGFNVSAPRAAENKQRTPYPLATQISSKYWPITHRLLLAPLQQNKANNCPLLDYVSVLLFFLICPPRHHLSSFGESNRREWQSQKKTHRITQSQQRREKSLLVFCGNPSDIILQTWGDL